MSNTAQPNDVHLVDGGDTKRLRLRRAADGSASIAFMVGPQLIWVHLTNKERRQLCEALGDTTALTKDVPLEQP